MTARLIAAALALLVTGAPVVTTACQGLCAARGNDRAAIGQHHSCHEEPAAKGLAVSGAVHVCGHSDEGPIAIGQSLWSFEAPAVSVAMFSLPTPVAEVPQHRRIGAEHGPKDFSPHQTQLRI